MSVFNNSSDNTRVDQYGSIFYQIRNTYYFQIRFRLRDQDVIKFYIACIFDILFYNT